MRDKVIEMRQERASLWEQAKALNETTLAENRDFTALEQEQYDKLTAKMDSLRGQIDRTEKIMNEGQFLSTSAQEPIRTEPTGKINQRNTNEYRAAFERFILNGPSALSHAEVKAMQADSDQDGGYWVMPQQMSEGLIKDVDDAVIVRQLSTGRTITQAKSLGVVTLAEDLDDAEWTTELKTGSRDDLKLGQRELRPHPAAKRVRISNTLLRLTAGGAESVVRERLAYKHAITAEKAYMTGDGNQKPLGLFTASDKGIPTSRDVSDGNTATGIKFDGLINSLYSLKSAYQLRSSWLFHRDATKDIRKLKDGEGQYLWQPSVIAGEPDLLLGRPFYMSEFAPNTFTSGQYVGIIGDFSYYWYVDALDIQIQRLVELYAETNETGFISRWEGDAMPILGNAFSRVKLA
jgi:HK97 family phage major capsid protein